MKNTLGAALPLLAAVVVAGSAGCGSETDNRPAKWSYISAVIVQPNCATANCHSALAQRSAVDLSHMAGGWERLVGSHFVIRECSAKSPLIGLLRGEGTRRMPPTFALPNADIALIERWIDAGAPYDGPKPAPGLVLDEDDRGCTPGMRADGGS